MSEVERPWFCYMLRCKGGLLYTGIATNVPERVKEHNWGVGAIFTSKRRPVENGRKSKPSCRRAA